MHAPVSGSTLGRVGVFKKEFLLGTRTEGGTEPQQLVSVPNIIGLNPKYLRSAYDVKAYVLLIAIRTSDVKPGGPLGAFSIE